MANLTQTPEEVGQQDIESLRASVEDVNIADRLSKEELEKIGQECSDGFEYDYDSRNDWEKCLEEWTDLALQVKKEKTWPWVGASNVKYPLLSTASMQFNARAYPSLIPATGDVVKAEVVGRDPTGEKLELGKRISEFMSYQLLKDMEGWEEDMDKLLIMLPIVGTVFKKTYFDSVKKKNVSCLVLPKNLVVNYWAKCLEDAERVSEIIELTERQVKGKQMAKIYRDVDLGKPQLVFITQKAPSPPATKMDQTVPYQIIEQHTYYDLDGDGYAEPYVITFERATRTVLRITARFDDTGIFVNDDGSLKSIEALQYYTKFGFIPNPDGSFYDLGFGLLLSPLNESVNTLINQLIDAGTLSNMQAGFLGKGLKLKMGESRFTPGEWKTVQTTADDLRKQIVPLPAKEPSNVLLELMGTLITSGKELASVAEIFVGKMPGQNTPATTTMATIEQGMKVFTAVYKRVYRSLQSEFKKLFILNSIYLDSAKYAQVMDIPVDASDFDPEKYDICPAADPNAASSTEKLMKAQGLMELLPSGALDPVKVIARVLEAQEQPNYEDLFSQAVKETGQVPPPQDPKLQEMQMKGQIEQQKMQMKGQELAFKSELEQRDQQFQHAMEAQKNAQEAQHAQEMNTIESANQIHMQRIFSAEAQQKMNMSQMEHKQKMSQMQEQGEIQSKIAKQKASSMSGSGTQSQKGSSKPSKPAKR